MSSEAENLVRVMSPGGSAVGDRQLGESDAKALYESMVLARTFDEKAISLHRQGRIGTYAPMRGQEAAQVGAAAAMAGSDYLFPTYRDHAMFVERGIDLREVLLHLLGDGQYVDREDGDDLTTFTSAIPIATQLPHAVGVGMAAKYKGDEVASLVSFGDGATSEGDFHEGMNFAGVFQTPTVFFCQNNGYAISVPRERQTASATIAQKAQAYGFEGVRVDGNDVFAVHDVVSEALEKAKNGGGPTLIEAVTYRRGAHTTTDDPSVYRDEDDAADWLQEDPLDRSRTYLEEEFGWAEEDQEAVEQWATEEVARAVEAAEDHTGYEPEEMFEHVYEEMPAHLREQRRHLPEDPQVGH
ncbi:pyruvate dehydrogenase (acetyl-transferring) E1 component subunit alpha [Haloarchaeobius litoreus]|uniref:Pyruvate dehydrogenase (Acetyl-transferring) E1 component subunit alpha n=1 Tax=Haloarchaeobius litoreus TaxID=755306 RepID=A0ABD6DIE5_9EURY|nr:pyruvate dehydrogenase (acetyl-transferring) E1 component subunit alpha [Haloarchaeobius litoreus]